MLTVYLAYGYSLVCLDTVMQSPLYIQHWTYGYSLVCLVCKYCVYRLTPTSLSQSILAILQSRNLYCIVYLPQSRNLCRSLGYTL